MEWCEGPRTKHYGLLVFVKGVKTTLREGVIQGLQQTGNAGEAQTVNLPSLPKC